MSWNSCVTLPSSCALHFERQIERGLVLNDPLLVGERLGMAFHIADQSGRIRTFLRRFRAERMVPAGEAVART